ncbi:Serine/threonine phosphatase stp [compost metagenome]
MRWEKARAGDLYLLCSDGLTDLVTDGEILKIVQKHGSNLDAMAAELIETANAGGGTDNITVGLVLVE